MIGQPAGAHKHIAVVRHDGSVLHWRPRMGAATNLTIGRKAVRDLLAHDPARIHKLCIADGSRGAVIRDLVAAARA